MKMIKRVRMTVLTALALGALGVGGSVIANAAQGPAPKASTAQTERGTQESTASENSAADPDNVQSTTGPDSPEEQGGEPAESGSEVRGDDGPGGHADEPANPDADHQFQGAE